jgi:hypothetical protein
MRHLRSGNPAHRRIFTAAPAALVILMVAVVPQKTTSKIARLGTGLEGAK